MDLLKFQGFMILFRMNLRMSSWEAAKCGNLPTKKPNLLSTMKTPYCNLMITTPLASLAAATACLLLGSCASTTVAPPPPGSAIIDAKPDADHRKQIEGIEGIELVSINGKSVKGTRSVIQPGPNTIKTRFRWPQGQDQEADLRFYATPGITYFINYDVYPPRNEGFTSMTEGALDALGSSGDPYAAVVGVFLAVPISAIAVGERIHHGVAQQRQSATYIDLMVVAHHSSQGTVRRVRTYPDGRVDEKPWAAWAQTKAP